MKKVIVAIDSMKGCLGSLEASEACAEGIRKANPEADVIAVPVADGGEGTAKAIAFSDNRIMRRVSRVTGPDGEMVDAEWWMDEVDKTVYMDMAAAAGLTLMPKNKRNPIKTTTYGVGELILSAIETGAKRIVVGMGGSATVDGGVGACRALGVVFKGEYIEVGGIDPRLKDVEILLACDVRAPFTGKNGAARVFGPQKGADKDEVEMLESRLEHLREIILKQIGVDLNEIPGSGAAGGCAGGLMALVGAKIEKGAGLVLDSIGFGDIIADTDLIITGEGSADSQTLMGKLPFEILQRGRQRGIPVALVAGRIEDKEQLKMAGFSSIIDINSPENVGQSHTEGKEAMDREVAMERLKVVGMRNFL